jgi:hypothetical protein
MSAIAATVAFWGVPAFSQDGSGSGARIAFTEGTVRIQRPGSEGWLEADSGAILVEGERLSTREDSRAGIEFLDGQVMRLGPGTMLSLTSSPSSDSVSTDFIFHPGPGDIWVNFGSIAVTRSIACSAQFKKGLALAVPFLDSIPAIFRMEIGTDSTVELKVYRGLLFLRFAELEPASDSLNSANFPEYNAPKIYGDIRLGERTLVIKSYQKLVLTSKGEIVFKGGFAQSDPDEQISWVDWNRSLDKGTR